MSSAMDIKFLAVKGSLQFRDHEPKAQRAVHFTISDAQQHELRNGGFDLVALVVPEEVRNAGPIWIINVREPGNVPPNFWTVRVTPRKDRLFAVWIPPHGRLDDDASIDDMKKYETNQHIRTVWGFV